MGEKDSYYRDRKNILLHAAIHEFVTTRSGGRYGLHPLFNLLSLCVLKPLFFVVFTDRVENVSKKYSTDCGWRHSFPKPYFLQDKFNKKITGLLNELDGKGLEKAKETWILDPSNHSNSDRENDYEIHAIGVFYLHLVGKVTGKPGTIEGLAGKSLTDESTFMPLSESDFNELDSLISAIVNYRSILDADDYHHRRHIEKYMQSALRSSHSLFSINEDGRFLEIKENKKPIEIDNTQEVVSFLKPIVDGLDRLYCELRGGESGVYDAYNSANAGCPLIWSRDRENDKDRRPPNISFYMQVKAPHTSSKDGYRIIPIVTPSMCKDYAYLFNMHFEERIAKISDFREYFDALGIDGVDSDDFISALLLDPEQLRKEVVP